MAHAPSIVRALIQEAKRGGRPMVFLLREARAIEEPSHAAEALFALSEFVPEDQAGNVLGEVAGLVGQVERGWRRAEVIATLAKRGPSWRNGDDMDETLDRFQRSLVRLTLDLEGSDLSAALPNVARWCPEDLMVDLLRRALTAGSNPLEDGKCVLALGENAGLVDLLMSWPDAALRSRLLAYHHNHAATPRLADAIAESTKLSPKGQVEVLRGVIASLAEADLETVHAALPTDPESRARLLAALAARADRLGEKGKAAAWFAEGTAVAAAIPEEKARTNVLANLAKGTERLVTGKAPAPPPSRPESNIRITAPAAPTAVGRPILALVDTYDGNLGETHLRAIGRAAPLCWAFGLDLALVGFPGTLEETVKKAAKETHIGEGEGYVTELAGASRIHWVPVTGGLPTWPGLPIATTPSPDPAKAVDFPRAQELARGTPLVVLMGLGKRGLPPGWLKVLPHHLELTGRRVSLETATAMGIIAERMRQLKP
ncbi:MAG: DUF531 family protein [Candidatus Thermoplasmatota archaeon]